MLLLPGDSGRDGWRYCTVGLEFTLTFLLLLAGGIWLDMRSGTMPAYTLLGGGLGFGSGLYRLLRSVHEIRRAAHEAKESSKERR
jgi:F0F1-type ATP synthase assembly protein I